MADSRIARAQSLRDALFRHFILAHAEEYQKAHREKFPGLAPPQKPVPEKPWQDFMEELLFDRPPGVAGPVDRFLAARTGLGRADRALLRSWTHVVRGFFRVQDAPGGQSALSLVNEVAYPLPAGEHFFPAGAVFIGRLFPIGDGESLPGTTSTIFDDDADRQRAVVEAALQIQSVAPEMAFRDNPRKFEESRRIADARYAYFLETFGGEERTGPGETLAADFLRFRADWLAREPAPALYPDFVHEIPEPIREAPDAGLLMDRNFGLGLLKNYTRFLRVCAEGTAGDEEDKDALAVYVANAESIAPAWRRALDRTPDTAKAAVAGLVGEDGAGKIMAALRALLDAPPPFPPIVAVFDPVLADGARRRLEPPPPPPAAEGRTDSGAG